jgi:UDP-N-acetylglucosamine:LPS N-acetylglucosamine transferase
MNNNLIVDFRKLDSEVWKNLVEVRKIREALSNAQEIITASGETFKRKEWKSEFYKSLAEKCRNPIKAEIIAGEFEKAFKRMKEGRDKKAIRSFVEKNCIYFGAVKAIFNFENSSITSIMDQSDNKAMFEEFCSNIQTEIRKLYADRKTNNQNVAILTCNSGGGHKSVAEAMKGCLEDSGRTVKMINVDEIYDPLDKATNGAVKTWHIFSKFLCQQNNHAKYYSFSKLAKMIKAFIPDETLHKVNEILVNEGIGIIYNTVHHKSGLLSLSTDQKVPIAFVNTDYELHPETKALMKEIQSDLFYVLTPIDYKIESGAIRVMGYPIREGFEKPVTEDQKLELKNSLGMNPNESLVVVQMGSLGMRIEKMVKKIIECGKELNTKTHFVFLCGNNKKSIKEINKIVEEKSHKNIQIHTEGFLNDYEMARYYKTCDYVVGKPGGATTAELAACRARLLCLNPLPWEVPNLSYLEYLGLGNTISSIEQLPKFLNKQQDKVDPVGEDPEKKIPDWKTNLNDITEEILNKPSNDSDLIVRKPKGSRFFFMFKTYAKKLYHSFFAYSKFLLTMLGKFILAIIQDRGWFLKERLRHR